MSPFDTLFSKPKYHTAFLDSVFSEPVSSPVLCSLGLQVPSEVILNSKTTHHSTHVGLIDFFCSLKNQLKCYCCHTCVDFGEAFSG